MITGHPEVKSTSRTFASSTDLTQTAYSMALMFESKPDIKWE